MRAICIESNFKQLEVWKIYEIEEEFTVKNVKMYKISIWQFRAEHFDLVDDDF